MTKKKKYQFRRRQELREREREKKIRHNIDLSGQIQSIK